MPFIRYSDCFLDKQLQALQLPQAASHHIAKTQAGQTTLYGWDGDLPAFEIQDEQAEHYLFEPGSFVPLAQVHTEAVRGVKVPNWNQYRPYDSDLDPLRKPAPEPSEPTAVYYYHTDHLGTPQALTDEQGALALEMDYQAWGKRGNHRRRRQQGRHPQPLPFPRPVSGPRVRAALQPPPLL